MAKNRVSVTFKPSEISLLGIAFVVLKLTHCIDWSWWWVLAPFWAPLIVVAIVALCVTIDGS
ncbi:MAG: hypothetical protein DRG33_01510 [Deltaproteobacteria bacterium]|nr:MAG: hypothetical protein DRG33_01510 [Deltaproteobacteria bacterium]